MVPLNIKKHFDITFNKLFNIYFLKKKKNQKAHHGYKKEYRNNVTNVFSAWIFDCFLLQTFVF